MNEWAFGAVLALAGLVLWVLMFWIWRGDVEEGVLSRPRVSWKEFKKLGRLADGVPGPWDYWTNGPGDVFALPLINFAVGVTVYQKGVDWQAVLVSGLLGFLASYGFFRIATKPKRAAQDIDWWFRFAEKQVHVSLAGWIHLTYFAFQVGIVVLGAWYFLAARMTVPISAVFFAGLFLYLVTFILDAAQGHFD